MHFTLVIVLFTVYNPCIGQTLVGKVYVGESTTDTTDIYTVNENYIFNLELPVYVTVEDIVGNEVNPSLPVAVTVMCRLTTTGLQGYSQATFDSIMVTVVTGTSYLVPFSDTAPGRVTNVECWGVSNPAANPPFTNDTSIANKKRFEVRPAGTVSPCSPLVNVPKSTTVVVGSLLVELSEVAETGNVTVECSADTSISNPVDVTFTGTRTISIGSQRVLMPYTVAVGGVNPVNVTCTADTIDSLGNIQFYPVNSTGEMSVFAIEDGSVQLLPVLTQLRHIQMSAFLVLDAPITSLENPVEFVCRLFVTNDTTTAANIAQTTPCDSLTDTPSSSPANSTDGWTLRSESITFPTGSYLQKVELVRQGQDVYSQAIRPEVIVVHCCAPDTINTNPKYLNQNASFIAVAYLSPNVTTSWDQATVPGNQQTETVLINPAYVDLSPCPCDLTNNSCDVNCCCDQFCTDQDKLTFDCITGVQGGEDYVAHNTTYNCSAEYFDQADWFPFMCIQFENSAFLGFFRQPVNAIRTQADFDTKLQQFDPKYSFQRDATPDPLESGSNQIGYKDGLSVKTGRPTQQESGGYDIGPNYRLVLPGRSLSGQCVFSDPVVFGKEGSDSCVWQMTEGLCGTASPLNALNFAIPSKDSVPNCRRGLLTLQEQGVEVVAETNVDYHCAGSDPQYLTPYLRSNQSLSTAIPDDQVKLFQQDLPNGGQDCSFDPNTGAYLCSNMTPSTPEVVYPPLCAWDDGLTKVPTPELDTTGAIAVCKNAVVQVKYNFTWQGQNIVLLNASVVLADIPLLQEREEVVTTTYLQNGSILTQTDTVTVNYTTALTQISSVEWNHELNDSTANRSERTRDVYKRSGAIGYETDLPVYSGVSMYNSGVFDYIDQNTSSVLGVWKTGPDSLCESSSKQPVNFRQSQLGSCLLRLNFDQLTNCTDLRKLVLNKQDELMTSNYIGQGGDPDATLLSDWVIIHRQDISSIVNTSDDSETTTFSMIDEIVSFNYRDDVVGVCSDIPSHINVDIMYGEVGKINSNSTYQIVGAKISYTLSEWALHCTAADGASCYGNTAWLSSVAKDKSYVQSFVVSSSVNFIKVPANTPVRQSKFQVDNSYNVFVCENDACFTEIFYPFRRSFPGDDYQYVLSFSFVSLVFLIGLFAITRPWW